MGFDVKKTTRMRLLDWLCPHRCRGCGRLGELLCSCCKNDILVNNLNFRAKYLKVLCVGKREGLLGEIVKEYKYSPVRAMGNALAGLLGEILAPRLKKASTEEVIIVPLPTIAKHIRQRGFDHMWLVAKILARGGRWQCQRLLERTNNAVQVGKDKDIRLAQAQTAYRAKKRLDDTKTYVLIDDVWTTGASMQAAGEELKKAGAKKIIKMVISVSEND